LDPGADGLTVVANSPINFPFVAYKSGSLYGEQLRSFAEQNGYCDGYEWSEDHSSKQDSAVADGFAEFFGILIPILIILFLVYMWFGGTTFSVSTRDHHGINDVEEQLSWYQRCVNWFVFGDMSSGGVASTRRASDSRNPDEKYKLLVNPGNVVPAGRDESYSYGYSPPNRSGLEEPRPVKARRKARSPPPSVAVIQGTSFDSNDARQELEDPTPEGEDMEKL
jgi:hypothetical protein